MNPPDANPALPFQPSDLRHGTISVQIGALTGSAPVRIYARPPRLAVSPPSVAVSPGGSQAIAVRPVDEWGQPLLALGIPIHWSCPPELGEVDESGHFHAAETPGQGELTVEFAGTQAVVPVVIGTQTRPVPGFEKADRWSAAVAPPGVVGTVAVVPDPTVAKDMVLRLAYDFRAGEGTRAVYARTRLPLGRPLALRLRVRGDGGGAWLRARLRDARGHVQLLDFARHLGRTDDWQELTATVPAGLPGPLTLEALYLVETDPSAVPHGVIELAGLAADYAPAGAAGGGALPAAGRR